MESELARAKWLFAVGILFIVSCFMCYAEADYLLNGRQIEANVTDLYKVTKRGRFGESSHLKVDYTFTEPNGTSRTGSDTVGNDWKMPASKTVSVQYTPGAEGRSRLFGSINWVWIVIFFVSILVMGFFGIRLYLEAREATKPIKRKRRRARDD
jgi:hypothetical protein